MLFNLILLQAEGAAQQQGNSWSFWIMILITILKSLNRFMIMTDVRSW